MLEITGGAHADDLAARLAEVLRDPLADPMAAEWIVVVSGGTERWLRLELSRRLGSSGPERTDGVAANLDMMFPGRFSRQVLDPDPSEQDDPWDLDRVAWVVLDVLARTGSAADERLGPLDRLAPGATRWARARRLADLFDRYLEHRPEMIRRWAAGQDVDGMGQPIPRRAAWQPHLWRLVRKRIAQPSPAELRPERLAALREGVCSAKVPRRVSLFGLTTIPGGAPFLDLLDALSTQRDVHLLLHEPSPALTRTIQTLAADGGPLPLLRGDDTTAGLVRHPLLRSWGRPAREGLELVGARPVTTIDDGEDSEDSEDGQPLTLLAKVQADIRADAPPAGDFRPAADDRSIRIHECHGATRQVEVLRDQILHLLADDPTLDEDDIVVLCPDLDQFAPLIESVLGPPADAVPLPGPDPSDPERTPTLRYRITDRSLRATSPLLGALGALVELLDSRFSDSALLDFANLGPVRERFDFDDDDLTTLADWAERANIRWGLDGSHRARWGIPASYEAGSWRSAVDRLLMGIAVSDDPDRLAVGEILPIGVEGGDTTLAGRLADLLGRLARLADEVRQDRPVDQWVELLRSASASLFSVGPEMQWQASRLAAVFERLTEDAMLHGRSCPTSLALADVRHLIGAQLQGTAGRADFFRGGVTVSSLTPLRGLPFRAICLLGMDEAAFASGAPDGDDVADMDPYVGDRDRRADTRQALLDTVLAAGDLVVIRSGHSVVTNQPVPPAVAVAEFKDAVADTLDPSVRSSQLARLTTAHPRQSFDELNFLDGGGGVGDRQTKPWSFDPVARAGAAARSSGAAREPFLADPLSTEAEPVITLAELREFLQHPPRYFLQQVLQLRLPEQPSRELGKLVMPATGASGIPRPAEGRDLVLGLENLESWGVLDRFLTHRRKGGSTETFIRRERAGALLPPGRLAEAELDEAAEVIEKLIGALDDLDARAPSTERYPVDVTLADGTRIVGSVAKPAGTHAGPIEVTVSKPAPKRRLGPWLDLLALTATDPSVDWDSVLLTRTSSKTKRGYKKDVLRIPLPDPEDRGERALTALTIVVDLYRRGGREPLPLFPRLSPALADKKSTSRVWQSHYGRPDGADKWIQVAFDHADFDHITSLPVRADDPSGAGTDRATRYADVLWGAVEASLAPSDRGAES